MEEQFREREKASVEALRFAKSELAEQRRELANREQITSELENNLKLLKEENQVLASEKFSSEKKVLAVEARYETLLAERQADAAEIVRAQGDADVGTVSRSSS